MASTEHLFLFTIGVLAQLRHVVVLDNITVASSLYAVLDVNGKHPTKEVYNSAYVLFTPKNETYKTTRTKRDVGLKEKRQKLQQELGHLEVKSTKTKQEWDFFLSQHSRKRIWSQATIRKNADMGKTYEDILEQIKILTRRLKAIDYEELIIPTYTESCRDYPKGVNLQVDGKRYTYECSEMFVPQSRNYAFENKDLICKKRDQKLCCASCRFDVRKYKNKEPRPIPQPIVTTTARPARAQVKAVVSEKTASSAQLIIGVIVAVLVVLVIGYALLYRKAATKLLDLELLYLDAVDQGYIPDVPIPELSDVINDVIKTTLCCAKSDFPSSYLPPDVSRNCNAVIKKMRRPSNKDCNRSCMKMPSCTRATTGRMRTYGHPVVASRSVPAYPPYAHGRMMYCRDHRNDNRIQSETLYSSHNANARSDRNVYRRHDGNAYSKYKINMYRGHKHGKRQSGKNSNVNVNMHIDSDLTSVSTDTFWCQYMHLLKSIHNPNMNKNCFNKGRQIHRRKTSPFQTPGKQRFPLNSATTPGIQTPVGTAYNEEQKVLPSPGIDNTKFVLTRLEKMKAKTFKGINDGVLLKGDTDVNSVQDDFTQLGGVWITTVSVPNECKDTNFMIDSESDFTNEVHDTKTNSENGSGTVFEKSKDCAVDLEMARSESEDTEDTVMHTKSDNLNKTNSTDNTKGDFCRYVGDFLVLKGVNIVDVEGKRIGFENESNIPMEQMSARVDVQSNCPGTIGDVTNTSSVTSTGTLIPYESSINNCNSDNTLVPDNDSRS